MSAWNVMDSSRVPGASGIRYVAGPAETDCTSGVLVTPASSITVAVTPIPSAALGTSSDRVSVCAPAGSS